MQRYTIKQTWRSMKESNEGEFVRHEDVERLSKTNAQLFKNLWNERMDAQHKNKQLNNLVDHLQERVWALFVISAVLIGCTVVRLILWSLGAL